MCSKRVGKLIYEPSNVIGQGSFGISCVFSGLHSETYLEAMLGSGKPVAIKRVQSNNEFNVQQEIKELMQNVSDHPNVLRILWTEMEADHLFIAMELCTGTLEDYIKEEYQELPKCNFDEREILYQVTKGLVHLHHLGVVHGDIKPTNILIFVPSGDDDGNDKAEPQMKLADYGLHKVRKTGEVKSCWMAPEVNQLSLFDFKVDIYALGCIFGYTLTGGKYPFGEDNINNINERIFRIKEKEPIVLIQEDLKNPYSLDGMAYDLIKSMIVTEPTMRPTVEEVAESPFFLPDSIRTNDLLEWNTNISEMEKLMEDTPLKYLCRYHYEIN